MPRMKKRDVMGPLRLGLRCNQEKKSSLVSKNIHE
jgi:hypothetical protein